MIYRRSLITLLISSGLAVSPMSRSGAQDATFACKVLLCSQANWPTISYCVPIMNQAIWMQLLGVAVGICQQALTQNQQQQSGLGATQTAIMNPISCPSGSFPVSQATGGYTISAAGSMCGTPTSSAVQGVVASQCSTYTDGTCSVLFGPGDLTITNPPAPAQSGVSAGQ